MCEKCKLYERLLEHIETTFRESRKYILRGFKEKTYDPALEEHYKGMLFMENELLYNYFTKPTSLPKYWKRPLEVIKIREKLGLEE